MSSNGVIIIILVLLCLLLATTLFLSLNRPAPLPPTAETATPDIVPAAQAVEGEAEPPPPLVLTQQTVEGLYYGLRYTEVEALLEREADDMVSEFDPGLEGYTKPFLITWYTWNNADGSKVRLGFVNNKLERKHFLSVHGEPVIPEPEPFKYKLARTFHRVSSRVRLDCVRSGALCRPLADSVLAHVEVSGQAKCLR